MTNYLKLCYSDSEREKIIKKTNNSKNDVILEFKDENIADLKTISGCIQNNNNKSVVFVYRNISEDLHSKINIPLVPSLQEAIDFIEMENIQKSLDF